MYEYQAQVERIVDGDTIDLTVDLGFNVRTFGRFRLRDIDTAEIHGVKKDSDEYAEGTEHKEFVENWVANGEANHDGEWPFIAQTYKHETGPYGRYLADIKRKSNGQYLSSALLTEYGDDVRYQ